MGFLRKIWDVDRWHFNNVHLSTSAVIDFSNNENSVNFGDEERARALRINKTRLLAPVNANETLDHRMHSRNTAKPQGAGATLASLMMFYLQKTEQFLKPPMKTEND